MAFTLRSASKSRAFAAWSTRDLRAGCIVILTSSSSSSDSTVRFFSRKLVFDFGDGGFDGALEVTSSSSEPDLVVEDFRFVPRYEPRKC